MPGHRRGDTDARDPGLRAFAPGRGPAAFGTRAWIALLLGRDAGDPLFLQVKEGGQPGPQRLGLADQGTQAGSIRRERARLLDQRLQPSRRPRSSVATPGKPCDGTLNAA